MSLCQHEDWFWKVTPVKLCIRWVQIEIWIMILWTMDIIDNNNIDFKYFLFNMISFFKMFILTSKIQCLFQWNLELALNSLEITKIFHFCFQTMDLEKKSTRKRIWFRKRLLDQKKKLWFLCKIKIYNRTYREHFLY